ncbi:MAG TPA: RNA methyltransferase [Solirubrobacteraceae bacterium]|nr:RNA methyltransferase [Solirubrobacteraceae bacterium]
MSQIASAQNPRLKALRRLHTKRERARSGLFLAEGEDLIAAAAQAGVAPLEGYRLAGAQLDAALHAHGFHEVERAALAGASALGSGSRVIAVYPQRWQRPAGPLCLYLHGVADPGNVGAVLRSARAFGASCVALGPGCADPHSPKAVRASMGAIFTVALARAAHVAELPGERVALRADAPEPLRRALASGARADAPGAAVTLLIGSERHGLPAGVLDACERSARIPIAGASSAGVDSLNAAMAATVALYELTRDTPPGEHRMPPA